ncbi:MAG: outer membrane beta-barrel protein [Ferruginibacter sp.]
MKHLFTLVILFISSFAFAQKTISVKGIVRTDDGKNLSGATVILYTAGEKDTARTVSNEKGVFSFTNVKTKNTGLRISYIGFKTFLNYYDFTNSTSNQDLFDVVMSRGSNTLENVTLEANKVQIKEDTVSYKVDSTMYRKNDKVEDVLKQLPGVTVDKDGTVTAQGKQVTKVKVNGKEFFGGDVTTATRELNADMIDRVQIIDDYGDQSAFTGIKDGDPSKTLNIELKKDKNKGYFGTISAGIGTEGRYANSLSLNTFNNSRQVSVIGNWNNTNASTFNFGSGAMGNMVGGIVRTMGVGRGGAGIGSMLGNFGGSDGIGTTKSIGLNYKEDWSPKVSAYGSYSYSQKNTTTIKNISQQNFFNNVSSINLQNSNENATSDNHRLSFNIEYKMDVNNYFKFTPTVSYRKSYGNYYSDFAFYDGNNVKTNNGYATDRSAATAPNLNGNLLFNHRFAKKGRTLSVNLSGGSSSTDASDDYLNKTSYYFVSGTKDTTVSQLITQENSNNNIRANASYIEPLSKKQSLEFNYAYSRQLASNDKETFNVNGVTTTKTFVDSLSNIYDNIYTTNKFGVNFRTTEKKYNYSVGLAVQPATISSNSVTGKTNYTQHLVNYYPVVRFAYNFSRSRSFNVNYNGSTNQPSYTQLQPVYDYSNPQYITLGNPNLKPEFSNTLSMRYNNFDFITGNVFFGNLVASFTKDKIVNNVFDRGFGRQETQYLNADGYYMVSGFYNISKPIQGRKYVFNLGGNITYNHNIGFVNDQKNEGKNWVVGQRFSTDIKIKKWLETSAGVNVAYNNSEYSLQKQFNSNTVGWTFSHNSRIFLPKDFIFTYDMDKTINNGYASTVASNPFIINSSLEKQLKIKKQNISLKLAAIDLLNENINISRNVSANYITDTRTNKLGRYFMLSAIFRLNKFSGSAGQQQGGQMRMMGAPPPPPHF